MKILLVISKDMRVLEKIVLFKKAKKRGTVIEKIYTKHIGLEKTVDSDNTFEKCIAEISTYRMMREIEFQIPFIDGLIGAGKVFIDVEFKRALRTTPDFESNMFEAYFNAKEELDYNTYQFNILRL